MYWYAFVFVFVCTCADMHYNGSLDWYGCNHRHIQYKWMAVGVDYISVWYTDVL